MRGHPRRVLLRFGALGAAGALGALFPAPPAHAPDTSFVALRRRWLAVTAATPFDPAAEPYRTGLARLGAQAAGYRDTMAPADGWLWPDQAFPSFVATPARLRAMARAHVLPGTGLTGDAALATAVATGIDHYRARVYSADAEQVGNWWHWRIGVPRALLDAALLIGPHLTARQRAGLRDAVDRFVPESVLGSYTGTSTAANRVDLCTVMLLRAMLDDDHGRAALAAAALAPVFPLVSAGDGFYRDGSFIQHTTIPYQGAYGVTLLTGLATLFAVLRGSPWPVADQRVFDAVERSFAPFVHDGFVMDLVRGRSIARQAFGDHRRGRELAAAILQLAESASATTRSRWRAMVKGWAVRDTAQPMLPAAERSDLAFHARLAAILDDEAIPAAAEPTGHRLMTMSARAVHRRPGWCAALSMASHRVGHYEYGNGENLRGWHTGSGMLYWWAEGHGDHYSDAFWATADPYRLPGTTVSTLRLPDGAGGSWGDTCPPGRWVGGATDGEYATAGQHLNGLESTLEAFKTWVFLDDAVICLGAGITAGDGVPVETIVDNRRTTAPLTVERGWAHLAGHGGYVLPGGPALRTLRAARTAGTVTRDYVTLWLDHGADPQGAGYVYLLMPGATRAATRARAADPGWMRVLANTAGRQGVRVPALGLTAVNFWQEGTAGPLGASAPCAVLVRERGDGTATVTVADPRRALDGLTVTWDRPVRRVLRGHRLLADAGTGARLTLTFGGMADDEGASHTVTVRL
ncbi:lyase [Spongiactinospora rosea]|uniref:Lyase n=1 Tax=Spongiactinospora rosea TaxID=2248750 RepID=A0A366LYN2_9ACTN|nr:polysaccharide lyase 8 family protein [Spongiactinospora rosea]RBQ18690.1 lyase [Spongiactinospora rosea]